MSLFADLTELQPSEVADNDFLLIYARSLKKARKVKAKAFRQGEVESVNGKKGAVQLKMPDVVNVGDNLSYNEQTNTLSADAQEITVDSELSGTSTNPVQNKVVKGALETKVDTTDSRLTDARPASDVYAWAKASTKPSYNANEVGAIPSAQKGTANGIASLDENGKVPSSQLPSYVDDVLEYASLSSFPSTGESGKIYIAQDTNKTYRWSGTAYAEISESLALGETSSTAFAGNRGKAIEDKIPSDASSSNKLVSQSELSNATVAKAFTGIFGMLGGANQISANTIDGLIAEVTGAESGGGICGGSVSLSASRGVPAGWHNFLYIPHRTGRGGGDNYLYGTLFIIPMTENSESFYVVHYIGGNIYDAKRFRYDYSDYASTASQVVLNPQNVMQFKQTSFNGFVIQDTQTNALYIEGREAESGDSGGVVITNDGVTVFGAGDTDGVFRVINEDSVASGAVFKVMKDGQVYPQGRIHGTVDNADTVDGYHVGDAINSLVSAIRGNDGGQDGGGGFQACMTNQNFDGEAKWWHKLSMDWSGNDPTNWISQLFLPTQEGGVPKYRRNNSSGVGITQSTMHDFITDENIQSILDNYTFGHKSPVRVQCNTPGWDVINGVFVVQSTVLSGKYYAPNSGSTPTFDTATPPPLNLTFFYDDGNYETKDVTPRLMEYSDAVSFLTKDFNIEWIWLNTTRDGYNYFCLRRNYQDYASVFKYNTIENAYYRDTYILWCYLPSFANPKIINGAVLTYDYPRDYQDVSKVFRNNNSLCLALRYKYNGSGISSIPSNVKIGYNLTDKTYYESSNVQLHTPTPTDIEKIPTDVLDFMGNYDSFFVYNPNDTGNLYYYDCGTKSIKKETGRNSRFSIFIFLIDISQEG